jgi:23S rRNA pseudouridine1911/1915/1917 synthase
LKRRKGPVSKESKGQGQFFMDEEGTETAKVNVETETDIEYETDIADEEDAVEAEDELSEQIFDFTADTAYNGIRIDKYLSSVQSELSRSYIQKLMEDGRILLKYKPAKANNKVKSGDTIRICLPKPVKPEIIPENIPLDIIYEDKDIIIINKQKGLVVHPAPGHTSGTLVNALLYHCQGELSGINGVLRPGIVHRIDRDTTGVMVACKNDLAHQFIAEQLKVHSITRRYQAIVYQAFKIEGGRVEAPIGRDPKDRKKMAVNYKNGKPAATNYKVLENFQNQYAYIECSLETGRTHQIRVHMSSIHHPLIGDTVYGPDKDPFHLDGQALHAGVLGFIHPTTREYVEFQAPLPDYFTGMLEKLRHKG